MSKENQMKTPSTANHLPPMNIYDISIFPVLCLHKAVVPSSSAGLLACNTMMGLIALQTRTPINESSSNQF